MITDARLLIAGRYITSNVKVQMMWRWRFACWSMILLLLWNRDGENRKYHLEFPKSYVLYLRCTENTPDFLEVEMVLPDGQICQYKVPTVKLKNIQKEVLLRKIIIVVSILYYSIWENGKYDRGRSTEIYWTAKWVWRYPKKTGGRNFNFREIGIIYGS